MICLVLLLILWGSCVGGYLNNTSTYDNAFLLGTVNFIIISAIMMIIPAIFQIINQGKLKFEKGKNICKYNSIALFAISVLLDVIANISFIGGFGAIIYYYINLELFVEKRKQIPIKK